MKKVLEILSDIGNTTSRNEKENILSQNRDNELLKEVLQFVFNPYILTGLSSKKINKKIKNANDSKNVPENILEYLKTHNTGRDEDILLVQNFILNQPVELQELYKQIVTKDLKIGITAKTINKIHGETFIAEFNVMLAEKYRDYEEKIKGEFIVTQKLDGVRCVVILENGNISVFSRQGQPIEDLTELLPEFEMLLDNQVYDGELLLRNDEKLDSKTLYRKTVKVTQSKGEKKGLEFHAFDMLPVSAFKNGKCLIECAVRKNALESIITNDLKYIKFVPILYKGIDKAIVDQLLEEARNAGQEGIMVNIADAPYECKRTKHILKVKAMESADLKVIGFEEGEGKYRGVLGALVVDYKGYQVKVGSGYIDEDRKNLWDKRESLIGKIVEVQYFEESENEQGGKSLRFPVFKEFRDDKTEESYN